MNNRYLTRIKLVISIVIFAGTAVFSQPGIDKPVYLDPAQSIDNRVEDLLSRMTLEEKVGQLNMGRTNVDFWKELITGAVSSDGTLSNYPSPPVKITDPGMGDIGPVMGFFGVGRSLGKTVREAAEFMNQLQKIAIEDTRLGIPLMQIEEGTHGLMMQQATIFPEGLAIGSAWNLDLVRNIYNAVAKESRSVGVHQIGTLVIEPYRDPRMGRNEEGYSEDPYMCSRIAEAIVESVQGGDISADDKAVAILCHYPGQSEPVSGLERGEMEISERKLREVFLPPWEAGIKDKGALAVMVTYPSIDGIPAHSSGKLLQKILREELGFKGYVLSEGIGVHTLEYEGIAPRQKEAGALAVNAGVDVGISSEPGYRKVLIENVEEGKVSMETINTLVRRVLKLKFQQGLFEKPYVDPDIAARIVHSEEHVELALQSAREGIVLLKNEKNILPLDKNIRSIAVIGPNADAGEDQLGDYTRLPVAQDHDIVTVLDGIKTKVSSKTKITYVKGCNVMGTKFNEIAKARNAARNSDLAIVVVGESQGTNGEGNDVADLDLTGLQEDLIRAVHETGTPTIVVLINGRPLSIRWTAEHIPAIIEAWNCGEQGGNAIADVLFGDYNPSGKLTVTVPRHAGQLPVYYNHKKSKAFRNRYVNMPGSPLFEFGYGLSYTEFEYSNMQINRKEPGPAGATEISVDVQNTGDREGSEVVQLYVKDVISTVTTPDKELKGYSKIKLDRGEKKTVNFTLTPYHLSLLDKNLERVVEPGTFEVMIGSSSENIRVKGSFEVTDN